MTEAEGNAWLDALRHYRYEVHLSTFQPGFGQEWQRLNLSPGNRDQTINLENRFRRQAAKSLEAWYAVVLWKMYSQKGRASHRTSVVIERVARLGRQARDLWTPCSYFLTSGTRNAFATLQTNFVATGNMPIVATFPAFMDPERFPMVDSRIATWVSAYLNEHPREENRPVPHLSRSRNPKSITFRDWDFYEGWVHWCRTAASALVRRTSQHWRARDVEMAVFHNAGELRNGGKLLPLVQ